MIRKKGIVDVEKIIVGLIILLIFISLTGSFFSSSLIESYTSGFPSWFLPLILGCLGLGVIYLIRK